MTIQTINPSTGEKLQSYPETPVAEAAALLERMDRTFREWKRAEFSERAGRLKAAGELLRRNRDEWAVLMAREMGKPVTQGRSEIEKCAWVCDFFAENAERFLQPELVQTEALKSFVAFEPLGVVLAVMPWNFPFWQVFRCAAPALMAGNAVMLKHASNVPGCALAIEEVFRSVGFPADLFRTVLIGSRHIDRLIEHPVVKAVSLTGSVEAGKSVAAKAGGLLKKTVLELGGSDPYVVLEDCDLEAAVETCVRSRMINTGQSCIAAKRFIVAESIRKEFEERFRARMEKEKVGDPLDESTTAGPLARGDLRETLHALVTKSVEEGARLLTGGKIPSGKGWFYPPTVMTEITPAMAVFREETFGPAAAITGARDETEAIGLANNSTFGLGAAVFTRDRERGERIATKELEAGSCFVNDLVKSDPRLPFGGIKNSGYGRELAVFGIREFVNIKTVWVT